MIGCAEKALNAVRDYGQAEAYASETVVHTVYVDGSRISNIEVKRESGLSVRIADGTRQGKASAALSGDISVAECVRMAESVLRFSPIGKEEVRYAEPNLRRIAMPNVIDRRAVDITPEELREIAQSLIDQCDVDIPRAQIRVSHGRSRVMNNNGTDVEHESTLVYGHFTSMFRGDLPGEGQESYHGVSMDIPITDIAQSLSVQARDSASAHGFVGHEQMSVILPPGQLCEMLLSSIGAGIDGQGVKHGISPWGGLMGKEVASSCVTVTDDPTVPAPLSSAYDDEGTPAFRKAVIDKGVLKSFLRDTYCGESTGNGMRRSSVEAQGAFERTPTVKPMNLVIAPGKLTREQIVEQTDTGILVERFASPEADELSGSFGLNVRCGYLIKRGEVVGTVNNCLLAGNMLEALKSVEAIGCDSVQTGVICTPTMSFSGAELIGNRD